MAPDGSTGSNIDTLDCHRAVLRYAGTCANIVNIYWVPQPHSANEDAVFSRAQSKTAPTP